MTNYTKREYCDKYVNQIIVEWDAYKTATINISDTSVHSMWETINKIKTAQAKVFEESLPEGEVDDRKYYPVVQRAIETGVVNMDLDTKHIGPTTADNRSEYEEKIAISKVNIFHRNTNNGEKLNALIEKFVADGNIIVRKSEKDGEFYRWVNPLNIAVTDISAEDIEDTGILEDVPMNQNDLRAMTEWKRIDDVIENCNISETAEIPEYQATYRYEQISEYDLNEIKKEIGMPYKENVDKLKFVHSKIVMVKARERDVNNTNKEFYENGIIVFADEVKPEKVKISSTYEKKYYKPYIHARLNAYNGRFWGEGYTEIAKPYQSDYNAIANRFRKILKQLKMIYHTNDAKLSRRNIEKSFGDGDIIYSSPDTTFNVFNNQFPNLSFLVEESNRIIEELRRTLHDFEVSTGERLGGSPTLGQVEMQNSAVGKFFNYKRQRFALGIAAIYKRWIIPDLFNISNMEDEIEIVGDASFISDFIDYYSEVEAQSAVWDTIRGGVIPTKEFVEVQRDMLKQNLLKSKKIFAKVVKEKFKEIPMYITVDPVDEMENKDKKVQNILNTVKLLADPAIRQDPLAMKILSGALNTVGIHVNPNEVQAIQPQGMAGRPMQGINNANIKTDEEQ